MRALVALSMHPQRESRASVVGGNKGKGSSERELLSVQPSPSVTSLSPAMLLKRSPFLLVAVALLGFGLLSLFFRQEAESELEDLGPFYGDGAPSGGSFKILPDHLGQPPDELGEGSDAADLPLADESGASSHRNMPTETPLPNLKSPSLRMRMQMFLARPLLSHSAALAHNVLTCPLEIHDRQVNPDQLRGELENWGKMDVAELRRRRSSLVSGLEELESRGTELVGGGLDGPVAGGRKGIVIAGGNRVSLTDASLRAMSVPG